MPFTAWLKASCAFFIPALLLAGCGHHNGNSGGASGGSANTLTVAMQTAPVTFDPAMCQDVETNQMLQQAYEGLVQYAPDNKVVPCLADKWTISPDGLTYTFHLRPNVKFQNGMPVTADDAAYSLLRTLSPKLSSPVAPEYMSDIEGALDVYQGKATTLSGVKVLGPQTLSITITKPKAYWIDTLTYPTAWVECKALAVKAGTNPLSEADAEAGAGTGPFKVTRFLKDQEVDFAANPSYWDGAPKVSLVMPIILNPGTRHEEFAAGKIDVMRGLQIGDLETDKADPALKSQIKIWPRAGINYFALNETVYPPFKDPRVRAAFAYATDKQKISDIVTLGVYPIAQDFLPPGIPGGDPKFAGLPYDPAKAKALLAAAGYPGGRGLPPLDIYATEKNPLNQKTLDTLRQMYAQNLGVTVNERQMEQGSLIAAVDKNDTVPSFVFGWYADYLDPQDFYSLLLSSQSPENHTGYADAQFDAFCARADTERDPAKRTALYRQAAHLSSLAPPRIPLFYAVDPELISTRTHGLDDCLMGHLPYKHVTLR